MPYVRKDPSREPIPGALDCHDCYTRFRLENPGPDAHTGNNRSTPADVCTRISCAAGSAGVPPALLSWSGRPKRRMKRLTDIAYWEENWWKAKGPERLRLYRDVDFEAVRLLGRHLRRDASGADRFRVLEIGAAGSRVLPYLGRKLGCEVFGTDFSGSGCRLLRANLALQGMTGSVVCEDLSLSSLPAETFDLVYSSGLVEHFDDTRAVIAEHLRLVKPGGRLVIIVPNFQGIQGRIWKRLARPLWDRHVVFGPDDLAGFFASFGLAQIRSGYLGSFFIHIGRDPQWSVVKAWPGWQQIAVHALVRLANGLISLAFRLSPWRPHSRALSPAFFAEGTRPAV